MARHRSMAVGLLAASLLVLPLASGMIITIRVCKLVGMGYDTELGGCVPLYRWDYRDIVVHSQQLDRLGGRLTALCCLRPGDPPGRAFNDVQTGPAFVATPPGWTVVMHTAALPFSDPSLVDGEFVCFLPPAPITSPQTLGTFLFRTQTADDAALFIQVRGLNFAVGESGPPGDFGPLQIDPPEQLVACMPPSIPTVTEWGLVSLTAVVLGAGAVLAHRRLGAAGAV